jgi:ABC-2 type transport system permease protein
MMFPIGWVVLGHLPFDLVRLPLLVVVLVLAAVLGAAMGLTLGSFVPPDQITAVFTVLLTPLLFAGCGQYAWPSLSSLLWFKIVVLANPLTYASEAMRASLDPRVAHMNPVISVVVLLAVCAGFTWAGVRGFVRRAIG